MTDDRRRFARIVFDAPAWIERPGANAEAVSVIDLSLKGALVRADRQRPAVMGEQCMLRMSLAQDGAEICMEAEVRHIEGSLIGLACLELDLDSVTHLRQLIALNLGDPALLERDLKALVSSDA